MENIITINGLKYEYIPTSSSTPSSFKIWTRPKSSGITPEHEKRQLALMRRLGLWEHALYHSHIMQYSIVVRYTHCILRKGWELVDYLGTTFCSPDDTFSELEGRVRARGRAMKDYLTHGQRK